MRTLPPWHLHKNYRNIFSIFPQWVGAWNTIINLDQCGPHVHPSQQSRIRYTKLIPSPQVRSATNQVNQRRVVVSVTDQFAHFRRYWVDGWRMKAPSSCFCALGPSGAARCLFRGLYAGVLDSARLDLFNWNRIIWTLLPAISGVKRLLGGKTHFPQMFVD